MRKLLAILLLCIPTLCFGGMKTDQLNVTGNATINSSIFFETSPTVGADKIGKLYWDTTYKTLSLNSENSTNLQVGQETWIRGVSTENISNGQAVYLSGASGVFPTVSLANASSLATSYVAGLATQDIPNGTEGFISVRGVIHDINTTAWAAGANLYLRDDDWGNLTTTVPSAPSIQVRVGRVIVSNDTAGSIYSNPSVLTSQVVQASSGAGNRVWYLNDSGSDIPTYEILANFPTSGVESFDNKTVNANQTLIEAYATPSGGFGHTQFEGGTWEFDIYANVSSTTGPGLSTIKIYAYRRAGASETELFNVTTTDITTTAISLYTIKSTQPTFAANTTDRIVIKYYANTTKTTAKSVGFVHGGTTRYTTITTPFPIYHDNMAGLKGEGTGGYWHPNATEINGTWTGKNLTADFFIGDGSLLSGISGGSFNGTLVGNTTVALTLDEYSTSSAQLKRALGSNALTLTNKITAGALVTIVPNMTSNTTPEGEAFCIDCAYSAKTYQLFNTVGSDLDWYTPCANGAVGYKFQTPTVVDAFFWYSPYPRYAKNFTFEASDDNVTYTELANYTNGTNPFNGTTVNTDAYSYYRFVITECPDEGWGTTTAQLARINLYNTQDNYAETQIIESKDGATDEHGNTTFGDILGRTWIKGGLLTIDSNGTQINLTSPVNSTKNMSVSYYYGNGSLLTGMNYFKADVDGQNYNLSNITNLTATQASFPSATVTISITPDAAHCIATSEYSASYVAPQVFNSTLPLTGSWENNAWVSSNSYAPQSLNVDLDTAQVVNTVVYNNGHHVGGVTQQGARNFTFWGSNDSVAFNETNATNTTGWISLNASVTEFDQHAAVDAPDNKTFTVTNNTAYRFYCFKFADNWCGIDYIAIRNIKFFYTDPNPGTSINSTDIITKTITLNSNISAPAAGMMQYNATGFYGYNGTAWNKLD